MPSAKNHLIVAIFNGPNRASAVVGRLIEYME